MNSAEDDTAHAGTGGLTSEPLLVEDLMLLLLDDDGASISGAGVLHYILGGAVLVEMAMEGHVELDDGKGSGWGNGPIVKPVGGRSFNDPLLAEAYEVISKKEQRVQPVILALGSDLRTTVLERLETRGLIRKETGKFLGIFRTTKWPADDEAHEAQLRRKILAALVDGETPDERTAAVIGLVYASGAMPSLRPPLPWNSTTVERAKAFQDGQWGAEAVGTAVERTAAAIAVASAAAGVSAAVAASNVTR